MLCLRRVLGRVVKFFHNSSTYKVTHEAQEVCGTQNPRKDVVQNNRIRSWTCEAASSQVQVLQADSRLKSCESNASV
ncbi:hypothetical protein PAXRUDRAFT_471414 [Paxillus rubicundulus Ve08.2h10]|uniref:Uncharacterized protein n=1 Tax=Paxillus rubicundulus Ve08.2h10 TaxID=930991 RepID=A0A0D0E1F9_9AGAM|nr:hypothetical protein PAXRUDRAFT_471414 [Paxillus rubicundulus Ve08.2h10]